MIIMTTIVRSIVEGLLSHFFSPDRPGYDREDVEWFLELANNEKQWCSLVMESHEEGESVMEMPEIKANEVCKMEAESTPVSYVW